MQYGILGPLEVRRSGQRVDLGGHKQRALLAILLIERNRVVATDQIVDRLWDGRPPASAAGTLQGYLSHLRRSLRGDAEDPDPPLTRRSPGYVLMTGPEDVDADRFVALAEEAATAHAWGESSRAVQLFDQALALWRGEPLADVASQPFAAEERMRLEEIHARAVEDRLDAALALGWHDRLLPELRTLTARHPLRERLRGQLMLALYRSGRQVEALEVYRQGRDQLADELGIDPGPELQALEQRILRQDADLVRGGGGPAGPHEPGAPSEPSAPVGRTPSGPAAPMSPIIGRDREIDELTGILEQSRLVTVVGPGGTGKTRLAVEVAQRLQGPGTEVRYVVELAGLKEPALVPNAVAQAVGMVVQGDRDVTDVLIGGLATRHALVLLDNCEHLLEPVAALVGTLLRRCASLRVLATSRQPLRLGGEQVYPVSPLQVDARTPEARLIDGDAMRLFAMRAAEVVPGFSITAENRAAVRRICRELDGLPLALELAASRIRVLSPEQLVDRLEDRFSVLSGGRVDAEPHQRSLQAAVAWSVDMLEDDERQLFGALSVFSGGFELDAVMRMGAGSPVEVLDRLDALVTKSLVTVDTSVDPRRYGMLETLRDYAGRLLTSVQAEALAQHHAEWCADMTAQAAEGLRGTEWLRWLQRLDRERDNVRTALSNALLADRPTLAAEIAAPLAWYWFRRSQVDEARQWLERCVEARGHRTSASWARVVLALGTVRYLSAEIPEACRLGDEAIELARQAGADAALAEANTYTAYFEAFGDTQVAEGRATAGLELARDLGLQTLEVDAVMAIAELARVRGDAGRAEQLALHGVDLAQQTGYWWQERMARVTAARISLDAGRPQVAVDRLGAVIDDLHAAGDRSGVLMALHVLTGAVIHTRSPLLAATLLGAMTAYAERVGFFPERVDPGDRIGLPERIRRLLPAEEFAEAVARGRTMRRDEVVDLVEDLLNA